MNKEVQSSIKPYLHCMWSDDQNVSGHFFVILLQNMPFGNIGNPAENKKQQKAHRVHKIVIAFIGITSPFIYGIRITLVPGLCDWHRISTTRVSISAHEHMDKQTQYYYYKLQWTKTIHTRTHILNIYSPVRAKYSHAIPNNQHIVLNNDGLGTVPVIGQNETSNLARQSTDQKASSLQTSNPHTPGRPFLSSQHARNCEIRANSNGRHGFACSAAGRRWHHICHDRQVRQRGGAAAERRPTDGRRTFSIQRGAEDGCHGGIDSVLFLPVHWADILPAMATEGKICSLCSYHSYPVFFSQHERF